MELKSTVLFTEVQSPLRKREGEETKRVVCLQSTRPCVKGKREMARVLFTVPEYNPLREEGQEIKQRVYIQEYNPPKGRGESNVTRVEFY
jgi:hypothetical protein